MKVVIATDSFKGSLSSKELGDHLSKGIHQVYPESQIVTIPIADGGEGTVRALVEGLEGELIEVLVHDPLLQTITAEYGTINNGSTAVIEMAAASGLPLVPDNERNPLNTTTYGTGELIRDAIGRGCREFIIGIGGSATNDGGMGMLSALGFKFKDQFGAVLNGCGKDLGAVTSVDTSGILKELIDCKFLIACDVDNPFFGLQGAAHVYAPQKGANESMVLQLDAGLQSFAQVIKEHTGKSVEDIPGSGAAGGLGGGFVAFLNAELKSGIDIILDEVDFDEKVSGADFVITGEGKIDYQTAMGKAPVGVSQRCMKKSIPVIALGGCVTPNATVSHDYGISALFSIINGPLSLEEAMDSQKAAALVEQSIEQIFRLIYTCENKNKEVRNQ